MFKQPIEKEGGAAMKDTIIAGGVRVEGDFQSQGNIIVEGEVVGTLKTASDLFVGDRAKIQANVSATNAKVSGEIRGNVKIKERLELTPTSRVIGDVRAKVLIVEAGASVNGKISMGEEPAPLEIKETKNEALGMIVGRAARPFEKQKSSVI